MLSGEALYHMDFAAMVADHRASRADVTLAAVAVGDSVASGCGLMRVDADRKLVSYAEKPSGGALKAFRHGAPITTPTAPYAASMVRGAGPPPPLPFLHAAGFRRPAAYPFSFFLGRWMGRGPGVNCFRTSAAACLAGLGGTLDVAGPSRRTARATWLFSLRRPSLNRCADERAPPDPSRPSRPRPPQGVYCFSRRALVELLHGEPEAALDYSFGGSVVPQALELGMRVHMHPHTGYWRRLATIKDLHEVRPDAYSRRAMDPVNDGATGTPHPQMALPRGIPSGVAIAGGRQWGPNPRPSSGEKKRSPHADFPLLSPPSTPPPGEPGPRGAQPGLRFVRH